jgi:hypothetical protein
MLVINSNLIFNIYFTNILKFFNILCIKCDRFSR